MRAGDEIARQIASVATEVVHCARTWVSAAGVGKPENLSRSVMVTQLTADGRAIFQVPLPPLPMLQAASLMSFLYSSSSDGRCLLTGIPKVRFLR